MNGSDGKSAYILWKEDLANRAGTANPVIDAKTGEAWDSTQNTLNDFWEYLRGKDGADGVDGSDGSEGLPGTPGQPGAEVEIIADIPNVIVTYSQSEYGEYVRTTDGGVEYTVYGSDGLPAAGAVVTGMPGIDPSKSYTSDSQGVFIVPKEDLPEIQDPTERWGTVSSVTYNGKTEESAKNTYVPNRVHTRLVLDGGFIKIDNRYNLTFLVERKINPDNDWEVLTNYLPEISKMDFYAALLDDKDDPTSMNATIVFDESVTRIDNGGYRVRPNRFVIENKYQEKNEQAIFWDEKEDYCSVKKKTPYYGEEVIWNGTIDLVPIQAAPLLKTLNLVGVRGSGENTLFDSASGEFDFSDVDFTRMYSYQLTTTEDDKGITRIEPTKYTEEQAKGLTPSYIYFDYISTAGAQVSSSIANPSGYLDINYEVFSPYFDSDISVRHTTGASSIFVLCEVGKLIKDNEGNYMVDNTETTLPEVTVTYKDSTNE